jgi:hypothetical protein
MRIHPSRLRLLNSLLAVMETDDHLPVADARAVTHWHGSLQVRHDSSKLAGQVATGAQSNGTGTQW